MARNFRYSRWIVALSVFTLWCHDSLAGPRLNFGRLGAPIVKSLNAANNANTPWSGIDIPRSNDPNVLNFGALQKCIQQETRLKQAAQTIQSQESALQSIKTAAEQLQEKIRASELSVDQYSDSSVNAHNALIETFRKKADGYKNIVNSLNAKISESNSDSDSFNTNCAGKSYYQSDMTAINNSRK